jgi:hypothetical protein
MNIVAKISFHLCPLGYPGLTRTVPICQIRVRPKGLHNFAFYILNFDFPSHLPPMFLLADTYVPYKSRGLSITIEKSLQIALFMQNKPNFQNGRMNVSANITKHYENISNSTLGENKPNSKPNKPNCAEAKMNASVCLTRNYESNPALPPRQNKANSNPIKPNSHGAQMTADFFAEKD